MNGEGPVKANVVHQGNNIETCVVVSNYLNHSPMVFHVYLNSSNVWITVPIGTSPYVKDAPRHLIILPRPGVRSPWRTEREDLAEQTANKMRCATQCETPRLASTKTFHNAWSLAARFSSPGAWGDVGAFWIFISKRLEAWVCHFFSFHGSYSMGLSATLFYLENIIKHLQCRCLKDSSYDRFMQLNHEGTHLI